MRLVNYSSNILLILLLNHLADSNNTDRFNYRETIDDDFGPQDWDQVTCDDPGQCSGWPDGWELAIGWELSNNTCYSCPASGEQSCELHQQSPIDLKRAPSMTGHDNECYDYHWMAYQDGSCNWHDMIKNGYTPNENQFQIQRHALQILQPVDEEGQLQCPNANSERNFPRLDYSKGFPEWWFLRHTEVTVPSEHTQQGVRYDAEVHLAHFYSVDFPEDERKMGKVAIFLQKDETVERWDFLDKLICQWREVEEKTRNECGLPSVTEEYPGCRNPRRQVRQEPPPDPYPFVDCDSVVNSQRICKPSSCCEAERSTGRYCQNNVYDAYGDELTGSICWWCCPGKLLAPREGAVPITSPPTTQAPTEEPPRHQDSPPQSNVDSDLSRAPSYAPSYAPSKMPSSVPTTVTVEPTVAPSLQPSFEPSVFPTSLPSHEPISQPSHEPSSQSSFSPSHEPSSVKPSAKPSNEEPSSTPSVLPSLMATTHVPSNHPSTTKGDTEAPSIQLRDHVGWKHWYRHPQKQKPRPATATPTCTTAAPIITPSDIPSDIPSISVMIYTDTPSKSISPSLHPSTAVPAPISKFGPDPTSSSPSIPSQSPTTYLPTTTEPTTSSISGTVVFSNSPALPQEAPPAPQITCSDYRNNTRINFKRICRDGGCCDSDKRSAADGCHYAYNFFGDFMESVCRDCCDPPKQVAPAPPLHPVHQPLDCTTIENPFRMCKVNSCCDGSMTDYCEENYEEYGLTTMRSICWYCCSEPKELNPSSRLNMPSRAASTNQSSAVWSRIAIGNDESITTNNTVEDDVTTNTATQQRRTTRRRLDEWASDIVMDPSNFRVTENLEDEYLADIAEYRQRKEEQHNIRRLEGDTGNNYHHVKYSPYEWLREVRTEYYYRYEGSQMVPPCFETVHYRVMKDPIRIHPIQLEELERLLAQRIDPESCQNDTAGRERSSDSTKVDLNRPLQKYSNIHRKVFCECQDWISKWQEDQDWCELNQEERFNEKLYNFS